MSCGRSTFVINGHLCVPSPRVEGYNFYVETVVFLCVLQAWETRVSSLVAVGGDGLTALLSLTPVL